MSSRQEKRKKVRLVVKGFKDDFLTSSAEAQQLELRSVPYGLATSPKDWVKSLAVLDPGAFGVHPLASVKNVLIALFVGLLLGRGSASLKCPHCARRTSSPNTPLPNTRWTSSRKKSLAEIREERILRRWEDLVHDNCRQAIRDAAVRIQDQIFHNTGETLKKHDWAKDFRQRRDEGQVPRHQPSNSSGSSGGMKDVGLKMKVPTSRKTRRSSSK